MTSLASDTEFAALLADSHLRLVGTPLVDHAMPAADAARWLYEDAPFVLLAHNGDADPRFVQAIKLSMDTVGRYGGPCRQPRVPLTIEQEKAVRVATEKAIAEGLT